MVNTYNKVGNSAMVIRINAPKYFPKTMCKAEIGLVNKSYKVPCFFSSEKLRIVTAGMRKIKIQGDSKKNEDISAKPLSRILKSPLNSQRNNPLSNKNTAITKYPMGEAKKELISLFKIANITFIYCFSPRIHEFIFFFAYSLQPTAYSLLKTNHFIHTPSFWSVIEQHLRFGPNFFE